MKTNNLSEFRTELYGVGAIGVLAVHAKPILQLKSHTISYFLTLGQIGVYIFAFLSGIGLYFSLKNSGGSKSKGTFYRKRFARVFFPYLLIAGIWYGIKYFVICGTPEMFFYELSTLSYWVAHSGAWYVAMLLPLYLVYPFAYDFIESGNRTKKTIVWIICVLAIEILLFYTVPSQYTNYVQVLNCWIVFFIGHYFGEKVWNKTTIPFYVCLLFIIPYPLEALIPYVKTIKLVRNLSFALLGVGASFLLSFFFERCNLSRGKKLLRNLGNMSLELYLTNIFLIQALDIIVCEMGMSYGGTLGALEYVCIIIFGVLLSDVTRRFECKILKKVKWS